MSSCSRSYFVFTQPAQAQTFKVIHNFAGRPGGGTVYEMTPFNGGWTESVIYSFVVVQNDGYMPQSGVIFDQSGNLYGTTYWGGPVGARFMN